MVISILVLIFSSVLIDAPKLAESNAYQEPVSSLVAEADALQPFSMIKKQGYSIWGLQPGEKLSAVLESLSEDIAVERLEAHKVVLQSRDGRRLALMTVGKGADEAIVRIGVFPVTELFCLEHSGVPIIFGKDSPETVQRVLSSAVQEGGGYQLQSNELRIHIGFRSGQKMLSAGISTTKL